MVRVKKIRLVNPEKKARKKNRQAKSARPRAKKHAPKKRSNPAQLITLGYLNPTGGSMPQKGKKKKQHKAARRGNPFAHRGHASKQQRKHRRRHNPDLAARSIDMVKIGALALGGLVITRQVPQLVLGARNTGVIGYIGNAVVAAGSAALATKFVGRSAGQAVLIGGALYTVERLLNEQLTPLGKALSLAGVGDARAAGSLRGIGPAYFPVPVVTDRNGRPQIPDAIINALPAPAPAPAPRVAGMGRFGGRF